MQNHFFTDVKVMHLPVRFSYKPDVKALMKPVESELFVRHIKKSGYYLEFGMGGSTIVALSNTKAKVYSVESDFEWIRKLKKYWFIRFHLLKRLSIYYANIGNTKEWGYPVDTQHKLSFPDYSSGIFKKIDVSKVDCVLIDGRFRVASVLQTILHCHKNSGLKILFHDFYNRPRYHEVLKYLSEIEKADTLAVFNIRPNVDLLEVATDYELFKFSPP